ncbi:nuclear transport factor 2 family protein [Streptomyces sp. NPDC051684]|uniref:nuclear transport factor 2 family protein n=1 Tax=Streptomyces sp. NPDC051684 TaxID=3365670 RepID=UPI0037B66E50
MDDQPIDRPIDRLIDRFLAAIEAGDIDTVRSLYAPHAVIWHNDDLVEQSVEDNLKVLRGLHRTVADLRYEVVRRARLDDGALQQHVLHGTLPGGVPVTLHAAMYLRVEDGRISRIDEYLDSAHRATIRAAREAQAG